MSAAFFFATVVSFCRFAVFDGVFFDVVDIAQSVSFAQIVSENI